MVKSSTGSYGGEGHKSKSWRSPHSPDREEQEYTVYMCHAK